MTLLHDAPVRPTEPDAAPPTSARDWFRVLGPYRQASTPRAVVELVVTILPFAAAWAGMAFGIVSGHLWLAAALLLPTAGFVLRLFMIQHDCGHGSFFPTTAANQWTGRLLGVLTLTPFDYWRRTHAMHHASSGNLAARGMGDIDTLTVREYRALSFWGRLRYKAYRHPAVMFGIGPLFLFGLQFRLPFGMMRHPAAWTSTMGTNAALAVVVASLIWFIGLAPFLLVHLPVVLVAASVGVWLFYVQHQFEDTHWSEKDDWNAHEAALHGSSHYDLPGVLRWFTANIGIHHVHHLASRIPSYRLGAVLREHPELKNIGRLTLMQSFACVPLVLWDGASKKLVSFKQARALQG